MNPDLLFIKHFFIHLMQMPQDYGGEMHPVSASSTSRLPDHTCLNNVHHNEIVY